MGPNPYPQRSPGRLFSIYLFLAVLGLLQPMQWSCCIQAFSSCGQQGLLFVFDAQASHCNGFSCSVGAQALDARASVVAALRLSCSEACGIFPNQGWNPCPALAYLHAQLLSRV